MSGFETFELSVEQSRPVELYNWSVAGSTFFMTNQDASLTLYNSSTSTSTTYMPVAVTREEIIISRDARTQALVVGIPTAHPLAQLYANNLPGTSCDLSIYRIQSLDSTQTQQLMFFGTVKSVAFTDKDGMAQVGVLPISINLERQVPRDVFSANCNHVLYDAGCTVPSTSFQYNGTAAALTGAVLTVTGVQAAKGTGWAIAGFVLWETNYRLVLGQTGDDLSLILPFNQSPVGSTVSVFAGCDHTINTCNGEFENGANFLGFPNMATVNPFVSGIQDNL